jgi:dTDP-4-dehydrorhamnose 3,5-epimerase
MRAERLTTTAGQPLEGPLLLTPQVFGDARGFFLESWNQQVFAETLLADGQQAPALVQDNHSCSSCGVLRGLHWQLPPQAQAKLVRCVVGEIFDVAVDLRRSSATFGQWGGALLSRTNQQQLWIPAGFGHGFLTLSAQAEVLYKASAFWNRDCERSLRWDDPAVAIDWPLQALQGKRPLLSDKDAAAPSLAAVLDQSGMFA